jgi:hypothetical protein
MSKKGEERYTRKNTYLEKPQPTIMAHFKIDVVCTHYNIIDTLYL